MVWILRVLTIALLSTACLGQFKDEDDPCPFANHGVLSEPTRSTGYDLRPGDTPLCDSGIKKGWYRFTGLNGKAAELPTKCPGRNTCGTSTAIWMDGDHPSFEDGIVTRRLCAMVKKNDANANCCEFEDEFFVKNCKSYYIYYLSKQPQVMCPIAYCAGTDKRCPVGKWSNNGFEPCKDPGLLLDKPPTVKGVNVHSDKTFDMTCSIETKSDDAKQSYQFVWLFDGQPDPSRQPELLTGSQKSVKLSSDDLKKYKDEKISCRVITYYTGQEQAKNTYVSNEKVFGVEAVELLPPRITSTKSYKFECSVTYTPDDADQKVEVTFTFNGVEDPKIPARILSGGKSLVGLEGSLLVGHINQNIACRARFIYDKSDVTTGYKTSAIYFAGIQVSPARLDISVTEEEKLITVTSTIPIVCQEGDKCCLTFNLNIDQISVASVKSACEYKLCSSDWNNVKKQASITISVVPNRNSIAAGTREAVLSFQKIIISGAGDYIDPFKACTLSPIPIVVTLAPGFTCSGTGDPHFSNSDTQRNFDLYQVGDYTLVDIPDRDFKVEIRTWRCWAVTCICGVVVKERNNIIKVFGCNNPSNLYLATIDIPYALTPGTSVQRSVNTILIQLLSGSSVTINLIHPYIHVIVQVPASDRFKVKGLCGTFDGNKDNDFTLPDGTVLPQCPPGPCIPVAFTEAWRVEQSIFVALPPKIEDKPPTEICSCTINAKGKSVQTCSPRQNIQDNQIGCPNCAPVKDLEPDPWDENGEDVVKPELKPVDPNKKWPNDKGVTEAQARDMCTKAIQKSPVYAKCKNNDAISKAVIEECMGDILFGGTTSAMKAITSSYTSKCQVELAKDEKNYVTDKDGKVKLKPDISDNVCDIDCEEHGTCGTDGKCKCDAGWEGLTCQIDSKAPPKMTFVRGPGCSSKLEPCDSFEIIKSNVKNNGPVKCRIQEVNDKGVKVGKQQILGPIKISGDKVACPIPKTTVRKRAADPAVIRYAFSVSLDGKTFSNELIGYAVDKSCMDCDETSCKQKTNVCMMKKFCYQDGEVNKKNKEQICDVRKRPDGWSKSTC